MGDPRVSNKNPIRGFFGGPEGFQKKLIRGFPKPADRGFENPWIEGFGTPPGAQPEGFYPISRSLLEAARHPPARPRRDRPAQDQGRRLLEEEGCRGLSRTRRSRALGTRRAVAVRRRAPRDASHERPGSFRARSHRGRLLVRAICGWGAISHFSTSRRRTRRMQGWEP